MALLNTSLWDSILPGASETSSDAGGIDTAQVVDQALWDLHAASRADLVFWTEAQLYQWMDEAVKRLASLACVFVGRDVTLTVPAQAAYAHPQRHVSTLHVTVGASAIRPAATAELDAKDPDYATTQDTPTHWYADLLGMGSLGLYPVPDEEVNFARIYEGYPETVEAGQTIVPAPAPLKGYLGLAILKEAYGIEGEMESADIAAHCAARMEMYEQIFQSYYGGGI